jgi:hypothetical protein
MRAPNRSLPGRTGWRCPSGAGSRWHDHQLNAFTFFVFLGALALVTTAVKFLRARTFGRAGLLCVVAGVLMIVGAPIADRLQTSVEQEAYGDGVVVVADATPGWYSVVAWLLVVAGVGVVLYGWATARSVEPGAER